MQLSNTQICAKIIIKHQILDHDIYTSFARIANFVYLAKKKFRIFNEVYQHAQKALAYFISNFWFLLKHWWQKRSFVIF